MAPEFAPGRVRLARWIAIAADVLQIALLPLTVALPVEAAANAVIDVVVGVALCVVLRPHWAFLPTFVAEAVPLVDVVPLWTIAVLAVTRGSRAKPPDALPPRPGSGPP